MFVKNLKALFCILFATAGMSPLSAARASESFDMGFFTISPPRNWHTEFEKGRRLLSSRTESGGLPSLMIESCLSASGGACPSRCDLPTIRQSGILSNLELPFKVLKRVDGYFEYAASTQDKLADGTLYTSIRLLCVPSGFVYSALTGSGSAEKVDHDLASIIGTIHWK